MKLSFIIALLVILSIYFGMNYYIGQRGLLAFGKFMPAGTRPVYWGLVFCLPLTFFATRFGSAHLPAAMNTALAYLGAYWMGVMYYAFLLLLLIDLALLVNRRLHLVTWAISPTIAGIAVVCVIAVLFAYGSWNAWHPRVRNYTLSIAKSAGSLSHLRIVMASDMHLGYIVNSHRLAKCVEQINAQHPDLVVFPGDTIDEDVRPFREQHMGETLRKIQSRYGSFAVLGNHEYIGGQTSALIGALEDANITVLRDDNRRIADALLLVGRDERSRGRHAGQSRKSLTTLMQGQSRQDPIILLDHQPFQLEEAEQLGVDLQLSGHTHHGQFFPNSLITRAMYTQDWGYYRHGAYQAIVSCGYGTWGPPFRIGNTPELLVIDVTFTPPSTD